MPQPWSRTRSSTVRPACAGDKLTLRFRVGNVYRNKKIAVYLGGACIFTRRRPVLAPGEMEHIMLPRKLLDGASGTLTVSIEEVASK